jgi:hypothetical protein
MMIRRTSCLALILELFLLSSLMNPRLANAGQDAAVSQDRRTLSLHGAPVLDAEQDGFLSIHDVKPSPTGEYLLVIVCGYECNDNLGFLIRTTDGEKRPVTAPWDFILQSKAEWAADGQTLFYYRINSTGADPPRNAPPKGWVQVDVQTGRKSPGTERALNPATTYAVFHPSGRAPLTVHAEPDPKSRIVGSLPAFAREILVTGEPTKVGKETWVPIRFQAIMGWVNQDYLYEDAPPAALTKR